MRVFVPFDTRDPKSRLSSVLDSSEREQFAHVMLGDVLDVLQRAGHDPTVLATAPLDCSCSVRVDERPLSKAVNDILDESTLPIGVVMADLPLLTVDSVEHLVDQSGDVVIAPGLGGGTNCLVIRTPEFRVDYHGASFLDHRRQATKAGVDISVVDSFRLAVDIDDPEDLLELLLHGDNDAAGWLSNAGFSVDESGEQPTLSLSGDRQ